MDKFEREGWQKVPGWWVLTLEAQGEAHYGAGRLERAMAVYQRLIEMRPEASQYWAMLGIIHRRRGEVVQGLEALQRSVELDAHNRNGLVNLGEMLIGAGKVEEGVELLKVVFEMGYREGLSVEDQDQMTRRAGAQLAMMERLAREVMEAEVG